MKMFLNNSILLAYTYLPLKVCPFQINGNTHGLPGLAPPTV